MSHQDRHARGVQLNSVDLFKALQWLTSGVDWSAVQMRERSTWTPRSLTWAALLWVWSNESTLLERFACAQRLIQHLQHTSAKPTTSYQAFMKVLIRWTQPLVNVLQVALRKRMETLSTEDWTRHRFTVFGVDGSRIDLPRTRSHQAAYEATRKRGRREKTARGKQRRPSRQKHASGPQLWLTTLFHVGLNLPWDWRIGPADSSERQHAREMLSGLPANALLTADAGFIGYDFASTVLNGGAELLVRVGANVKLLKRLGFVRESHGIVYLWTDKAAREKHPPLVFRLVVVQGRRHPVSLITSVIEKSRLSEQQIAELYRGRWGVEVFYRHFKQTFGRRKLRSHASNNARVELEWSLVGLWAIGLFASRELARQKIPIHRLSVAQVLKIVRAIARDYLHRQERAQRLCDQIGRALLDPYTRQNKTSRNYPRKKTDRPPGKPTIKIATQAQTQIAQQIKRTKQG